MVRGLYTTYTGMVNSQHRLDVVSNNLANATTTGYKKEGCTTQSFDAVYGIKIKDATVGHVNQNIGKLSLGAKIGETYRNWEQGSFVTTDNTYDFALSGKGFFTISFTNKAGETSTMYTRDGSFQMNADGYLVTKDGDYVLGESGEPIVLPTDATNIAVEPTGEIKKYCPGDSPEHRQEAIRREAGGLCLVSLSIEHMTGKQAIELVQEDRRQADLPL